MDEEEDEGQDVEVVLVDDGDDGDDEEDIVIE